MPHFDMHTAEMAYGSGSGFFWATKVQANDTIHVVFDSEQHDLVRIVVATGNEKNPKDILEDGSVLIGSNVTRIDLKSGTANCENLQKVASFKEGQATADNWQHEASFAVRCIQIRVDSSQQHWAVFSRIAIFSASKSNSWLGGVFA